MAVVMVQPNKLLRLRGGLGPLQEHAVSGSMTIKLSAEGSSTRVEVTYNVGGFVPAAGGLKAWAVPVDGVVTAQFDRLKSFVEGRD